MMITNFGHEERAAIVHPKVVRLATPCDGNIQAIQDVRPSRLFDLERVSSRAMLCNQSNAIRSEIEAILNRVDVDGLITSVPDDLCPELVRLSASYEKPVVTMNCSKFIDDRKLYTKNYFFRTSHKLLELLLAKLNRILTKLNIRQCLLVVENARLERAVEQFERGINVELDIRTRLDNVIDGQHICK